ncbi:hypothetical protein F5H01DRAFT_370498 [Linnemannia elongata]|nr:hypothetical protein F5H01DRAFT_370498 [Linnemannia elongata]
MADTSTNTITMTSTPTQPHRISIFDIPELVAEVGLHLSYCNYFQCLLVSKSMYIAFQPLLWKHFDPPLDTPFADPTLIRRNLSFIENITLSVLDHDLLPIFLDDLPLQSFASPSMFLREQTPVSTSGKEKDKNYQPVDKADEHPLATTLPLLAEPTTATDNLYLDNQSRLTNLTTLTLLDAGLCLTPKQHLLFHSNILNLILQNPNINALHIPADLFSLHPKLFLDVLQHRLPRLERLELGPFTSKAYTYSPSNALDNADLELGNENVAMVANFSGSINWETTVQLLETCLWERQKNKANAFLTHLRCRYNIPDNINHIPDSVLESQYARICYPSSSSFTSIAISSSSPSLSSFISRNEHDEVADDLEEPRLKDLILPWWGRTESECSSIYTWDNTYLDQFIVPLVYQLPYLAQFFPRSPRHERFLEDEFDAAVGVVDADEEAMESDNNRGLRGRSSSIREGKEKLGPRYRWRVKSMERCTCAVCSASDEEDE